MNNKYIALAPNLYLHYFLSRLQIRDGLYTLYDLNTLQGNIVKLCDGQHTQKDIFDKIINLYGLDGTNKQIRQTFISVLNKFFNQKLIEEVNIPFDRNIQITGELGKAYPYFLSWELTNACNFKCPHCYKEADYQGLFASDQDFKFILENFKGKSRMISITGGEALMHPRISNILDVLCDNFSTDLVSNGILIHKLSPLIIKKLSNIQVCMYGYDNDSYFKATGYQNGYDAFIKTVSYIIENKGNLTITLIVHKGILGKIEEFVKKLIELNVHAITIGQAMPVGRAVSNDSYLLSDEDTMLLTNELSNLSKKYKGVISVSEFQKVSSIEIIDDYKLTCQAGRDNITISENGYVRQCHFFSSDLFTRKLQEYIGIIQSSVEVDYTDDMKKFEKYLKSNNKTFADMHCMGFRKFENI